MSYKGSFGMTAFGSPGLLNVYEANLRIAIGKSRFTQEMISHIAEGDKYARDFLGGGEGEKSRRPHWRSEEDTARFKRYEMYSDLYFGRQEKHLRPEWLPNGKSEYKTINWLKFVTKVYVDLMMGGGVEVKTGNQLIDDYIADECQMPRYFSDWATYAAIFGFVGLQIVVDEDGVDVIYVHPCTMFWKFKEGTNDDYEWIAKKMYVDPSKVKDPTGQWDISQAMKEDEPNKPDGVVFEERHYRGRIEYFLYLVKGDEIVGVLDPTWFDENLPPLNEDGLSVQETECDEFMLQIVPNVLILQEFVSDFDDLVSLQASINTRATQRARILNVHADPKLMLPESLQQKDIHTGEVIVRGLRDEVFFLAPEEFQFKPEYLTWDAQLDHVSKELEDDQNMLLSLAEISPTLVVGKDSSFPESGAAYKMKLTPTLNRVTRKEKDFKRALQILIHTFITKVIQLGLLKAISLEALPEASDDEMPVSTLDGAESAPDPEQFIKDFTPSDINIDFKPALPQDDKMLIERLAGAASISRRRVLELVDGLSEAEIEEELKAIDEDVRGADEASFPVGGLPDTFGGGMGTSVPPGQPIDVETSGGINLPPGLRAQTDQITSDMV